METSMDLELPPPSGETPTVLCNTFEDLKQYCYYVASVVGPGVHSYFWLSRP